MMGVCRVILRSPSQISVLGKGGEVGKGLE